MRYTQEQKDKVAELRWSGISIKDIEQQTGVKQDNIRYICKKLNIKINKTYTQEQKNEAIELRRAGLNFEEIEERTGIVAGTIKHWCLEIGLKLKIEYTPEQKIKAIELRMQGISLDEIANTLGIGHDTIRHWCYKENITLSKGQFSNILKDKELFKKEGEILELRRSGMAIPLICEKLNVSKSYVKRLQIKHNISIDDELKIKNVQAGRYKYVEDAQNKFFFILEVKNGELLTEYIDTKTLIKIRCSKNHEFETKPNYVNMGQWCQECHFDMLTGPTSPCAQKRLNEVGYNNHLEWYQDVAKERDGICLATKSDTIQTKIKWKCNKCACIWEASPGSILNCNSWCPSCSNQSSRAQLEIADFIKSIISDEVEIGNRSILTTEAINDSNYKRALELDIYVPARKFALEFNGLYWHSEAIGDIKLGKDMIKALTCHKLGIKYFMIYEDEWEEKRELIKAMIRQRLGVFNGTKIFARKLELRYLDKNKHWNKFFDRNHLDGAALASWGYGLYFKDKLIMCASVRKNFNKEIELARMATDYEYLVPGGASRILTAIKSKINGKFITFSNNRLSSGDVYQKFGGELISKNKPSYYYTDGNRSRIWRFKCKRINDPEILSEFPTEKLQAAGGLFSQKIFGDNRSLYKIEDAGHQKWLL